MAASYEARKFGVRSAMPSSRAARLCPDLLFVKPRFQVYSQISQRIREIFREYTELVEPLSLDEAYLDVTATEASVAGGLDGGVEIARRIKETIRSEIELTASAGVAFNKFLAKMASDVMKPNGLFVVGPEEAAGFLAALPIEDFHGVGRATAERMKEIGIYKGADLRARSLQELEMRFGKMGQFLYRIVRGEDHREVKANRVRKSVGAERTFSRDLRKIEEMEERLGEIAEHLAGRMAREGLGGRTLTLKIKYLDFSLTTRSTTLHAELSTIEQIATIARRLLHEPKPVRPVRLLGLSVTNLRPLTDGRGASQLRLSF
jgi:DNA polymerase-4